MKKPVVVLPAAQRDVELAVEYYWGLGASQAALRFIKTWEAILGDISGHSSSGSLRYAEQLSLEGLRMRSMKRYPYLVFYLDSSVRADVWRVLHERSDIVMRLGDDDDGEE